ncbi:MFS transporter [Streptomyces sp. CB01881]|uniref:MFS transporter n=1 Tax=Streptomyces sp. CB01881 TaxID=2078691 RepID=UPI000CDBDD5C|nr:MFS transporter [Streptomyces sp. CB01881]AUY48704.1 MFS transporter [Streptomyces sp. CB01881]TYC77195.1 MFS transporter [Streptomyces sp. CB01881]
MTTSSAESSAPSSGLSADESPDPGPTDLGSSDPRPTGLGSSGLSAGEGSSGLGSAGEGSSGDGPSGDAGTGPGRAARLLHPDPMVRRLAGITLVNTIGSGLSMAVGVLFFTRVLGLSAAQLGLGLTVAGLCGVAASVPAGRAADRWGARPVLVTLVALNAVATAGYTLVHSYPAFLALACVVSAVDRGAAATRNALYAEVLPADRRVAGRAYLRVVTNIGICLGTAIGAIALQVDTRQAYLTAILADAASYAVVAVLFYRLAVPAAARKAAADGQPTGGGRKRNPALRDGPFLVVTVLNALLCLQFAMLEVGVPLWVVQHTDAPRITVAATMIVNTVLVIALQVRATRGTEERAGAARACGRAGVILAASCLVIALAHGLPATVAAVVVLAGVALQALGEVLAQAGGWALSYDLAGERDHGAYQGVYNAGSSAALMIGPAVVSTAVIGYGLIGWAALGALLAAAGLAVRPAVQWAGRRGVVEAS